MNEKTNVMRILDKHKINYISHFYGDSGNIAGLDVAKYLNENTEQVFKTLVTKGSSGNYYVFAVPVSGELDLKKAAKSVNEKSVEMIKQKELLPLTGCIHGGCSPIGMKKYFKTIMDATSKNYNSIYISAGKIGVQVELKAEDISKVIRIDYADITK